MHGALLVLLAALLLGIPLSFVLLPGRLFPRILAALVLAGVAVFCVFGFLATREISDAGARWPWQVGYCVLGLVCLGGAALLVRPRSR